MDNNEESRKYIVRFDCVDTEINLEVPKYLITPDRLTPHPSEATQFDDLQTAVQAANDFTPPLTAQKYALPYSEDKISYITAGFIPETGQFEYINRAAIFYSEHKPKHLFCAEQFETQAELNDVLTEMGVEDVRVFTIVDQQLTKGVYSSKGRPMFTCCFL